MKANRNGSAFCTTEGDPEEPYYWINHSMLHHARTGEMKMDFTESEALAITKKNMKEGLKVKGIEKITTTGKHHEYRGDPLPAT